MDGEQVGAGDRGRVERDDAERVPPGRRCPACGVAALRQMVFGLPTMLAMERAADGEFILGGCVAAEGDAPRGCIACGVAVWPDRVFSRGDGRRHRVIGGLEWTVHRSGDLTVRGAGGELTLDREESELLVLSLAVQLLDDLAGFHAWLDRRGIAAWREGDLVVCDRFALGDEGFIASGDGGSIRVVAVDRLVLGLVGEALGRRTRSVAELAGWFEQWGVTPVVLDAA